MLITVTLLLSTNNYPSHAGKCACKSETHTLDLIVSRHTGNKITKS